MTKSKYIIFSDGTMALPIVFSPLIEHDKVKVNGFKAISAGFCDNLDGFFKVWGQSISLKLSSRPEDAEILNQEIERELI